MTTDPDVKDAFGFTDHDLAANRAGKLSGRQRLQLLRESLRLWFFLDVMVLVASVILGFGLGVTLGNGVFFCGVFGLVAGVCGV